jgi:hypothetical protein
LDPDDIEEENSNEMIIFILSLQPYDFLDSIRKVDSTERKLLYTCLYNYLYGDDSSLTQTNTENRLRRQMKYQMLLKYTTFADYLNEKEKVNILQDNYQYETQCFTNSLNYIKVLKEKAEKLIDIRDKVFFYFKI